MLIRCIDFETTGEPTEEDPQAVCEVGMCDVTVSAGDPVPGARIADFGLPWSRVTKLRREMPHDARAVHHISDDELAAADIETATVFMRLMGESDDVPRPDFFCAHNADYEREFFRGGSIPWICTYKVALRVWPDLEKHSLQFLRYALDLDIEQQIGLPAHRAGPDVYVGAALMARIFEEPGAPDLDTMVRWSKGAALLPKITFGNKFKGQPWSDADDGYLFWIIDKSDLSRDVKANAKHHLKLRGRL
ncbi:MAG: hypothetical protein DI527_00335 [Chelatococcus sp.]|nr:MAG: hypothetical protein DI527_00335 [Chelatococcus sp.]